jgi:hypothetical protein
MVSLRQTGRWIGIATLVVTSMSAASAPVSAADGEFTTGSSDVIIQYINGQFRQGWKDNGVEPSPLADDSEWARRVYLDLVGHIPPLEELEAFLADKDKATGRPSGRTSALASRRRGSSVARECRSFFAKRSAGIARGRMWLPIL